MEIQSALIMGRKLMNQHGLQSWTITTSRARKFYGVTRYNKRTIAVSSYLFAEMTEEECEQVVLHEIAHALTPGHHHDKVWLNTARQIGYTGKRCGSHQKMKESAEVSTEIPISRGDRVKIKTFLLGVVEGKNRTRYRIKGDDGKTYLGRAEYILMNRVAAAHTPNHDQK